MVHSHPCAVFSSRRLHTFPACPQGISKLHRCRHLLRMSHDHFRILILPEIIHGYRFDAGPFLSAQSPSSLYSPPTALTYIHPRETRRDCLTTNNISYTSATIPNHTVYPCTTFLRTYPSAGDVDILYTCTFRLQKLQTIALVLVHIVPFASSGYLTDSFS